MQFYTKVAGVTHDGRQSIIRNLYRAGELDEGTELILQREPNNPYDSFAVAVLTKDRQSIGYIPKENARQMSINMNSGMSYRAYVSAVTGGDVGYAYGVNLRVEYGELLETMDERTDDNDKANEIINKTDPQMQYSETNATRIYNLFVSALDAQTNFKYSKNPQKLSITILQIGVNAPQRNINLLIQVRDFDVIVCGFYENFHIPTESIPDMFELIARINDNYIYPQFVFDFNEYNIYCRHRQSFPKELLQEGFAVETILDVGFHLERCGKAFMAVSLGLQIPEEAAKSIN